jgi:alpha-galactosidase
MVGVSFILLTQILNFSLLFVVNIDDCWQWSRDAEGAIQPEPATFPNGIPALADYVHSKNLKFGLYSGTKMHSW